MFLHVEGEVNIAQEPSLAEVALEGFGPGVLPVVPCQLVRIEKLTTAPFPRAFVQLLPSVDPFVLIQVQTLCVPPVTASAKNYLTAQSSALFFPTILFWSHTIVFLSVSSCGERAYNLARTASRRGGI